MSGYLIDNCTRPIKVYRPKESAPSFYVNTMQEAFQVIDLDIELSKEAGYDLHICSASPSSDAQSPS